MSALLNAILLNALVATALAVVVWVTGIIPTLRRRPGLRHGLWIVVLLKLVTPPLFEMPILPGWLVANPAPMLHPKAIPLDNLPAIGSVAAGDLRPVLPPMAARNTAGSDWLSIAALVSGFGTLTVLTFATCQIWRLRRALRGGATNDERLGRIGGMAADRMGLAVVPTVCVVAANVSPLLWVRRSGPLIVLPRRLVAQFTDEQLVCVMSHEIAHYLRRDHWTNLLSLMVAAICWWNPIAWWARRELRMAQEACCDALVISRAVASRRKYAETLFQALEFIQAERPLLPALANGFGGKSSTERRFEMIVNPRVSHRLSWRNYALLIAALAVLPCSLAVTEAQDVASQNGEDKPQPGAEVKDRIQQLLQAQRQELLLRRLERLLEAQRASSGAASLNDKVRQLRSRLMQQYPDGRSAEFQQEFLRGLKAIERELDEQPNVETRVEEYERVFQRQLEAVQQQKQLNGGLRMPQFPLSAEDREALMEFSERAQKRVKEDKGNKRDQSGKESDQTAPDREQDSSKELAKPIGVPLSQWGRHGNDSGDGAWPHRFYDHLKVKDCRSCHRFANDSGDDAWVYRFHDSLKVKDCRSCHKFE